MARLKIGHFLSAVLATVALSAAANAAAPYLGRPVAEVLEEFRQQGNRVAYSASLVSPELLVTEEPKPAGAMNTLLEILQPHGLTLEPIEGIFVVVPAKDSRPNDVSVEAAPPQAPLLEHITVSASRYQVDRDATDSSTLMGQQSIENLPDVGSDPIRVSQRLPGVAASGASARAHFRGGELNEIGIILNGHRLFDPFHVRDYQNIFSTIDSRAIDDVEIFTGGFPAQFGDRMSGVVVLESIDPNAPRHTEIGLSVFNTSFLTSGQHDDMQWLFSARRGNLDRVISKRFGEPSYYDVFSQFEFALGENTTATANLLYADDIVSIVLEADPDEREQVISNTRSLQSWFGLTTDWSDRLTSSTAVSFTQYDNHRVGATNDAEKVIANVDDDREVIEFGIRQDWTFQPNASHLMRWGFSTQVGDAHFNYIGSAQYNGLPALFQNQPGTVDRALAAAPNGGSYSAYLTDRWKLSPSLILQMGLRWDDQTYTNVASDSQLSPRIGLLKHWSDRLDLRVSWGRYHQAQGIHELQIEDGLNSYWPAQRTDQLIAGVQFAINDNTMLRVEGFHKDMDDVRPRFENLFDPLALIPELQADRIRLEPSSAAASGLEVSLTGSHDSLSWWSSYTLSKVSDKISGVDQPRTWDQRHAFNAGISWTGDAWDISVATNVHSGWRTTALTLVDDAGTTTPVAIPGTRNALRLGTFASLDLRLNRRFEFRRSKLSAFLEISNVSNRRNRCCIDWDVSETDAGAPVLESSLDYWLPLLPAVGILWEF